MRGRSGLNLSLREVSEAHRRELTAALSSILRDAYDFMVNSAAVNYNIKVDDLARILARLDLSSHHKKFQEEGIDLAAARKLSSDQFEELGITNYSQRSSLMAALEAAGNSGVRRRSELPLTHSVCPQPTVAIENGLLSAWLPFVCTPDLERDFPVLDELWNFSKFELSIAPESQGGVEAHLNIRTSRTGVNEISVNPKFTTGKNPSINSAEAQLLRAIGLLSNLNISLSMYDALALLKQLEESRMVRAITPQYIALCFSLTPRTGGREGAYPGASPGGAQDPGRDPRPAQLCQVRCHTLCGVCVSE